MNTGTKVRTIAFAIACVNQAIASVGAVDLGNATANLVYNIGAGILRAVGDSRRPLIVLIISCFKLVSQRC